MALDANMVGNFATTGDNDRGGLFVWASLRSATYKWTLSTSGTNEYYVELAAGGDPSLTEAKDVYLDGFHNKATNGTVGSLNASEWDWGDNDTLGYNTVYVRLSDGADPDTKNFHYVGMGKNGGIDYTQQDAAQLSLTDLATDGAGTGLSSVTGGFTAEMRGNIIYIRSGTGFTTGWYEIVSYTDTNNVTIDRNAGVSATAGSGEVGGSRAVPTDVFYETLIGGNKIYYEAGTYTLTAAVNVNADGSSTNYIVNEGFNTTRGDAPTGTDRPLIACGANTFVFDNYYRFENIRHTGTGTEVLKVDNGGIVVNCCSINSSGTGNRNAFNSASSGELSIFERCDGESTNGNAFRMSQHSHHRGCVAKDSVTGFNSSITSGIQIMHFCIIDSCTTGISYGGGRSNAVMNCTIYNCTTGLSAAGNGRVNSILNNIFDSNTTAISYTVEAKINTEYIDYNNFSNNTTDRVNVNSGPNCTSLDPEFADAPNGDFSVGTNMKAIGSPGLFPDELTTGYMDKGAAQREEAGGAQTSYGYVG
jgi:hypothetical protein